MMMDSEEEEEQTALVCDNGKFNKLQIITKLGLSSYQMEFSSRIWRHFRIFVKYFIFLGKREIRPFL